MPIRQRVTRWHLAHVGQPVDPVDKENRDAGGKDIDGDAGDDLIGAVANRDHGVDQRHQAAREHGAQNGDPDVVHREVDRDSKKGPRQHHALHGNVDDTGSFGNHPTEGGQQQQGRVLQPALRGTRTHPGSLGAVGKPAAQHLVRDHA